MATEIDPRDTDRAAAFALWMNAPKLDAFCREYLRETARAAEECRDRDLSADCMVIGTSALVETELDGAVGMAAVLSEGAAASFEPGLRRSGISSSGRSRSGSSSSGLVSVGGVSKLRFVPAGREGF